MYSTPLEGIKVIELAVWEVGPLCGMMLARLGADVIKIEDTVFGDPSRGAARVWGVPLVKEGIDGEKENAMFLAFNQNKRSMTLDLKQEKGREILHRLIETADVFLINLRPGASTALGAGYDTLSRINPGLIYATGSCYGRDGPDRTEGGQDTVGAARAGLMFAVDPEGEPLYPTGALGNASTATLLAQAIMTALFVRERTGEGQAVEASELGSLIWLQELHACVLGITGREFKRHVREESDNPLMSWYNCKDGKWLCLGSYMSDKFWHDYCEILGIQELETDPKFKDIVARAQNSKELVAILDRVFATKNRDEWLELLRKGKSGIVATSLNSMSDVITDPQALANDYVVEVTHPTLGPIKLVGLPMQFSKSSVAQIAPPPEFGQHTEEVLLEYGFSWTEIERMRRDKVI